MGSGLNLSNLPLVGKVFPPDQTIKLAYRVLVASQDLSTEEVGAINALLPDGIAALPDQPPSEKAIPKDFGLAVSLQLGTSTVHMALPVAIDQTGGEQDTLPVEVGTPAQPDAGVKWFSLQKSVGPVHFQRIGVRYQAPELWFLLDASLSTAGLTLSLDGLAAGSPLDTLEPKFDLRGLGIDYRNGPLEIGGAFLRQQVTDDDGQYDEYNGAAVIKTQALTLSAMGSYARRDGHHSLFVYAVLDKPLGGPSFFFVTGLAAGFGYNRALIVPPVDQVAQFPLVEEAINGTGEANDLVHELEGLHDHIPAVVGQVFFAAGVRFSSFNLIDSFALLVAKFGPRFEIDLLGLSHLVVPTPEAGKSGTPLAEAQLALKASYVPSEGALRVQGQLTPASYVLSRACHLTGGFSFYTWFSGEHAGDFALTLGGYHPSFKVPDHYPRVPRLGINWQVNSQLSIRGNAYYALTPSAMMAGGHLQATWHYGNLKAWFNAGADFMIAWKPYHYDAHIYVNMGVSYKFDIYLVVKTVHKTISVDVGADLHVWGPEFAGRAHIDLSIISFDVTFGSGAPQRLSPVGWDTFRSFLPADDAMCGISVKGGLLRKGTPDDPERWIINPKDLVLVTNSVIPSSQALHSDPPVEITKTAEPAIRPMGLQSVTSTHTITITRDGAPAEDDFKYRPILKDVPAGLWGKPQIVGGDLVPPDVNESPRVVENALAGFEIRPAKSHTPGETHPIERRNLRYEIEAVPDAYAWEEVDVADAQGQDAWQKAEETALSARDKRKELLWALGFADATIDISQPVTEGLLVDTRG